MLGVLKYDVRLGQEARGLQHAGSVHGRHRNGQAV